jgi:hypothetical protein
MIILPTVTSGTRDDLYLPAFSYIFWGLAALLLWLSLSSCFDSVIVFNYAAERQPRDLKTVTLKIIDVSRRTPNFKVQFDDGTTAWLSFPDRLGGNPKSGLEMKQITDYASGKLKGCMATAKIRSALSAFGRRWQIWDLECPQAHLHYGPDAAASEIRQHPLFDLVVVLMFDALFLFFAFFMAVFARRFGKRPM